MKIVDFEKPLGRFLLVNGQGHLLEIPGVNSEWLEPDKDGNERYNHGWEFNTPSFHTKADAKAYAIKHKLRGWMVANENQIFKKRGSK